MPIRGGTTSVHDRTITDCVSELLDRDAPVTVMGLPPAMLVELTVGTFAEPPVGHGVETPIVVIGELDTLSALDETFGGGHQAAELARRGLVEYRVSDSLPVSGPVVVGSDSVVSVIGFERSYGLVETDGNRLTSLGSDRAASARQSSDQFEFGDRPDWRTVTTDLQTRTDAETLRTFLEVLGIRRQAAAPRTLDVPTIALLAGACTNAPQKGIAAWCERCDVAAASTVSNRKSTLAASDIVTTTRAPPDGVGAPVHELVYADEHLAERSIEDVYAVAADVLTGS